jgi:hypothetical protein
VSVMQQALLQSRIFQLKDIKLLLLHRVLSSKRCIACLQRGSAGWRDCRQQCQSCHRFVVMDIQFCIGRLLLAVVEELLMDAGVWLVVRLCESGCL